MNFIWCQQVLFFTLYLIFNSAVLGQQRTELTIQERLGYSSETKLLIVHADDLGVSHSENEATFYTMENGIVNSASAMVPCSWFPEVVAYSKSNPEADIGLHLTLSSEWNVYRWGPVSPVSTVTSLVDDLGYFHPGWGGMPDHVSVAEIESEIRAQIERSLSFGLQPTHLDPHMFQLFRKPEYLQVYLKLGREYGLPTLLNREMILESYGYDPDPYITSEDVVVDQIIGAFTDDYARGMDQFYSDALRSLPPGLHYLFIHPAFDNSEMHAITEGHEGWGARWRQADFNYFISNKAKNIIRDENIVLITWREIKEKLID